MLEDLFHITFLTTEHQPFTFHIWLCDFPLSQTLLPGHLQAAILWYRSYWGFTLNQRTLLSKQEFEISTSSLLKDLEDIKTFTLITVCFPTHKHAAACLRISFQGRNYEFCTLGSEGFPFFQGEGTQILGLDLAAPTWCCDNGLEKFWCCSIQGVILGHFRGFNGSLWLHSWTHDNWSTDLAGEEIWKTTLIKW